MQEYSRAPSSPLRCTARSTGAELSGTVTDTSGAVIPGADVVVTQVGTNATRSTTTNDRGEFFIPSLPVGRFTMVMTRPGFANVRVADIDLHAGDARTLNEKMQLSSVQQTVSVEADTGAVQLDKSNATFGGTVQSVQIRELPLNGRNIATLELLAPGAIDNGSRQQATIRFAGQGIDDTNYRFDGVDASGIYREALAPSHNRWWDRDTWHERAAWGLRERLRGVLDHQVRILNPVIGPDVLIADLPIGRRPMVPDTMRRGRCFRFECCRHTCRHPIPTQEIATRHSNADHVHSF